VIVLPVGTSVNCECLCAQGASQSAEAAFKPIGPFQPKLMEE